MTSIPQASLQARLPIHTLILDATKQPTPPEGLKYTHLTDPNTLKSDNTAYPVLQIGPYLYWALSYIDNREAYAILAYDQNKNLIRTWSKTGARYIWKIAVDSPKQTVRFIGQGESFVQFTINELLLIPTVTTADAALQPALPEGLKYIHFKDPDTPDFNDTIYPVLQIGGYVFWAVSYDDNRYALAILAYDQNRTLVRTLSKDGARYIWKITVDSGTQTVRFWGQSSLFVEFTIEELLAIPSVNEADLAVQPRAAQSEPNAPAEPSAAA